MKRDNTSTLTQLGSKKTNYRYNKPSVKILEVFQNNFTQRPYQITLDFKEFTSLCPKTGQPDFGNIKIIYTPKANCIETKSLKLYFFSWRNEGTFMETIVNTILEDCVKACSPAVMTVVGIFEARGGIKNIVTASYNEDDGF